MNDLFENWPELLTVERPGRYLGGEMEARPNQKTDAKGRLFKVALAFPDVYEIAHGHLGHKILYSLLNGRAGFSAERVYAPWPDWEAVLKRRGRPLASLENRIPMGEFDLVGFSLQYELAYTNILNMLELGGLPLRAAERDQTRPLIVAGGPGAYNPEPLADFFDLFFLGDAERGFMEDMEIIKAWKAEGAPKAELWDRLAGRPGLYIPALFRPSYDSEGRFSSIEALKPGHERVVRAVAPDLDLAPFPLCQITPLIKPVHDRVVVEIGRGCSRGCRFCQAGYIYRPVRERGRARIMDLAGRNLENSGQDEVSFLSLSAGDHSQISGLVSGFMDEYAARTVALSLPSLRVKSLSSHLARQIRRVRKTGFTLAPEAGTQRLRDVINKDLTDDDLMAAAEEAFALGWRTLKLYFMVGLPTETEEDLAGIASLMKKIKKLGRAQINLGVAHFTPKAHTPFQWHPASSAEIINKKLLTVRDLVKAPGLTPKWNAPGASWVESILARGDRRLGPVLERVFRAGARFEAWGDRFEPQLWREALEAENLQEEKLLSPFQPGEARSYGHLFAGVEDDFLIRELERSRRAETTGDCRWQGCLACGACHDGAEIDLAAPTSVPQPAPEEQAAEAEAGDQAEETRPESSPPPPPRASFLINFTKEGPVAFLGHLELVELFKRAFRRAGISLSQSQGFHPQPKISFLTALPLGVPSSDEYLKVVAAEVIGASELAEGLAAQLPEGVRIKGVRALKTGQKPQPRAVVWQVDYGRPVFNTPSPLHPETYLSYTDKKRQERRHLLSDFVEKAESNENQATITIKIGVNGTPKPVPSVEALWNLSLDGPAPLVRKIETILTE